MGDMMPTGAAPRRTSFQVRHMAARTEAMQKIAVPQP